MRTSRPLKTVSLLGTSILATIAIVPVPEANAGDPCEAHWDTEIGNPGLNDPAYALAVFDDGTGSALYGGGLFVLTTGNKFVGRWNGTSWSTVGGGLSDWVWSFCVHDGGSGPQLFAGGQFVINDGGDACIGVARWNGSAWVRVGDGMDHDDKFAPATVFAMASFDDGNGAALYAGGQFHFADDTVVNHVAKWDGTSWSPLGSGLGPDYSEAVTAMAVFDDGDGPQLYVAGSFEQAGGASAQQLARWNGVAWTGVSTGLTGSAKILAMQVWDDGSGPALYVAGSFTTIGGVSAARIAKFDGTTFSAVGAGVTNPIKTMCVHDDGSGPALYVGGTFSNAGGSPASRIAKWDGTSWSPLASGISATFSLSNVSALASFTDAGGPALVAGGYFNQANGETSNYIAAWRGCFEELCPADSVDSKTFMPPGDGQVDGADLAYLLGEWGANPGSLADLVDTNTFMPPPDGIVDGADLAVLLGAWGACE